MNIEINKENNKIRLLKNDGTLIIEGSWNDVESQLLEMLYKEKEEW